MNVERLSIEVTNKCSKGCAFCYNASHPEGNTTWMPDELVTGCISILKKTNSERAFC